MKPLPKKAQNIITQLAENGFEGYAIGGSVRDILMGRKTKGWDFTTNAKPEEILSIFPDSFYDNQFGTVGIKISDVNGQLEDVYEITTFRSEQGYTDRRHPDTIVWGTNLNADLSRRDFTINAIAYNGTELIDPYDGQTDIARGLLRSVGNAAERFREDALRMMRAIRIAAQLGFTIEEQTFGAIRECAGLITEISAERVRDEFLKLLGSNYPADGVLLLRSTGLLSYIIPELDTAFDTPQKSPKRHHLYDVGTHSVMALKHCPSTDPVVRFATLIHDIGKPPTFRKDPEGVITFYNHELVGAKLTRNICGRLRFSNKDTARILTLVRWHQFSVDERQTDSAVRRFIRHVGKEYLADILALRIGDRLGGGATETSWRLELFKKRLEEVQKQPFSVTDLTVNGNDVMEVLGCPPGPVVGKTLNELFAKVEEGILPNDRDMLLLEMKTMFSASGIPKSSN